MLPNPFSSLFSDDSRSLLRRRRRHLNRTEGSSSTVHGPAKALRSYITLASQTEWRLHFYPANASMKMLEKGKEEKIRGASSSHFKNRALNMCVRCWAVVEKEEEKREFGILFRGRLKTLVKHVVSMWLWVIIFLKRPEETAHRVLEDRYTSSLSNALFFFLSYFRNSSMTIRMEPLNTTSSFLVPLFSLVSLGNQSKLPAHPSYVSFLSLFRFQPPT